MPPGLHERAEQEDTRKTAREGKTRRDAAKAAREARTRRDAAKAAREARTRRDAAKRAREKFQPTLPSCSSLQMSHVTKVFASSAGGWLGGGGLFKHHFFPQCCRESFWENRGAEVVGFWWSSFGDMVPRGCVWDPSAGEVTSFTPPAPRRILTGRGPEAGQSSKVGGGNFPDPPPSLMNSISLIQGRYYAAHCQ